MAALDVRLVGLELKANVTAVKVVSDALQVAVDAIDDETSTWVLNGVDGLLPAEADVKAQLLAYEALSVAVSKPGNSIGDSIAIIKAAV